MSIMLNCTITFSIGHVIIIHIMINNNIKLLKKNNDNKH